MKYRLLVIVILVISGSFDVFAHGDEPRLEISVERVSPGGIVDLRGVDFERDEVVTLMLVNPQTALPLGEIVADSEGVFLLTVTLPADLAEGTYHFLAITDDHNIASPDLIVQGPAIVGEEGGGQGGIDEDDPLLAPMPTFAPGVVPGGVVPTPNRTADSTGGNPVSWPPAGVVTLTALALLAAIIVGTRLVRKR